MLRRALVATGLLVALAAPAQAQLPLLDIRIGGHAAMPSGDFADSYDAGFGAYARLGVPLGIFKLMGSATYTQFKAANPLTDDTSEISLQVGPHFSLLPLLDIGIEGAYFSDAEKFGLAPNISVGLLNFEATASYYIVNSDPKATWVTLGLGFRF
jgi:hypothetical protein